MPHAFSQRDLTLMQAVGAQIAAAIDVAELHERLKRAANTDALTGLHNYRYFYDRLEEEIARAARREQSLAVAFFDLDKLKTVNDTYGHLAGNEVLRTLGRSIGAQVRTEDVPARYGGDEFAIVMPDTPRDEAEKVVARLMETLENADVELQDGRRIRDARALVGHRLVPARRSQRARAGGQRRHARLREETIPLTELRAKRLFDCRLTPDRKLRTLDDAHAFLAGPADVDSDAGRGAAEPVRRHA